MFSFECSLVQRNEKKDFLSSVATTKPFSHLELSLKQRLILVEIEFEN